MPTPLEAAIAFLIFAGPLWLWLAVACYLWLWWGAWGEHADLA